MLKLERTYDEVTMDVKIVLDAEGYKDVTNVEVLSNTDGEDIEIHIESCSEYDPRNLIIDSTNNDGEFEHSLDDDKIFALAYGEDYFHYECGDTTLTILKREELDIALCL